jgi:hypothetical protein
MPWPMTKTMTMMNQIISVVLLLAVLPIAAPQASSTALPETSAPAACHRHGGRAPSRSPVTHECCEVGHQAAVLVKAPGTLRTWLLALCAVSDSPEPFISSNFVAGVDGAIARQGSPPRSTPLRV